MFGCVVLICVMLRWLDHCTRFGKGYQYIVRNNYNVLYTTIVFLLKYLTNSHFMLSQNYSQKFKALLIFSHIYFLIFLYVLFRMFEISIYAIFCGELFKIAKCVFTI